MNKVSEKSDGKIFISVECPTGYTGMDCVYRCLYPTYGEDCFMTCKCSNDTCDFVSGCKDTSTTGIRLCCQISLVCLTRTVKKTLVQFSQINASILREPTL